MKLNFYQFSFAPGWNNWYIERSATAGFFCNIHGHVATWITNLICSGAILAILPDFSKYFLILFYSEYILVFFRSCNTQAVLDIYLLLDLQL